jgi:hypothetical protein
MCVGLYAHLFCCSQVSRCQEGEALVTAREEQMAKRAALVAAHRQRWSSPRAVGEARESVGIGGRVQGQITIRRENVKTRK